MSVSYDFSGKKVLVTGASRGIGRAIALTLARAGAAVVALARNGEELKDLAREAATSKGGITPLVCDVTSSPAELAEALSPHQPFYGLVNNAGIAALEPVGSVTEEALDSTFSVNFRGAFFVAQAVTNGMREHGVQGVVVNLSSQAGIKPLPSHLAYCTAKAALDMAMRVMALELGKYGIRVNAVSPTVVLTEMGRANWSNPTKAAELLESMPLQRFAEVDEVTRAVCYLLSADGSCMTTGHALPIDGGWTTC